MAAMRAMILDAPGRPLRWGEMARPEPGPGQVLVQVKLPGSYGDDEAAPLLCAGIHMSDVPSFPYAILWGERTAVSVANLTRRDGEEFLALAPRVPVRIAVTTFPLAEANEALARLRSGRILGAAVLLPGGGSGPSGPGAGGRPR